jgi:hypothetical protein
MISTVSVAELPSGGALRYPPCAAAMRSMPIPSHRARFQTPADARDRGSLQHPTRTRILIARDAQEKAGSPNPIKLEILTHCPPCAGVVVLVVWLCLADARERFSGGDDGVLTGGPIHGAHPSAVSYRKTLNACRNAGYVEVRYLSMHAARSCFGSAESERGECRCEARIAPRDKNTELSLESAFARATIARRAASVLPHRRTVCYPAHRRVAGRVGLERQSTVPLTPDSAAPSRMETPSGLIATAASATARSPEDTEHSTGKPTTRGIILTRG